MKKIKIWTIIVGFTCAIFLNFTSLLAQTVTAEYLNPGILSSDYDFIRLGNSGNYWGGLMLNKSHPHYGDGNDFTIFSYGDRDIFLRPNTGNVIIHPPSNPSNGNVGIGTSSPSQKLDVNGNIILGMSNKLIFRRNDGNQAGYVGTNDRELALKNTSNPGYITFHQNPGGGTREIMRITNGFLGIGTTNPAEQLDVDGNIAVGINNKIRFRRSDGNIRSWIGNNDRELSITNSSGQGWITFFQDDGGGNEERMRIHTNGYIGIGTTNPTELLTVNGTAKAEEVIVVENVGADFVFEEDYDLPKLSDIETHIKKHKRLPEIPSAEEMMENGVKVGTLQMKLLQKIEELTLYTIKQQKLIEQQQKIVERQHQEIEQLKTKLEHINQ